MAMWEKILQKNLYSEWVIRNTLYWMTPVSPWKLEENTSSWIIFFEIGGPECEFEFGRLLNDFSLRSDFIIKLVSCVMPLSARFSEA